MSINRNKFIGLLTMPVKENYGGIIQVAALYYFLETNGYTPCLIKKKYDESFLKRIFRYLLSHNPLYFVYDYKNLTKRERQSLQLRSFIDEFFIRRTKSSFNISQYKNSVKSFDAVIVGSDQVWRYKYVKGNYKCYFLDYLPSSIRKIAYAASFGVEEWEGDDKTIEVVKNLLTKFDSVSVREDSGLNICADTFSFNNALHVLDPTFLPELDFYNGIINKEEISKKVNLFTYVLDNRDFVNKVIKHSSESLKLEVNTIKLTDYKYSVNPSIAEWLYHFREAKFIVTDSFHGVVFSILFKKQFICIGNKFRGYARFKSLFKMLGLTDRLVFEYDSKQINSLLNDKIDYDKVEILKAKWVEKSKGFLINGLRDDE